MLIECNTFQKHSADSKLSTNTYLMSVAACISTVIPVKVDVTLVSIETKLHAVQHSSQFNIVYIWISKFNAIIATLY